jgi:hypothetical protein
MTYTPKFYWDDSTIEYLIECYDNDGEHHMILRLKEHVDTCHLEDDETYEELEDDLLEQVMQAIG